jgi:hypothetical protein
VPAIALLTSMNVHKNIDTELERKKSEPDVRVECQTAKCAWAIALGQAAGINDQRPGA